MADLFALPVELLCIIGRTSAHSDLATLLLASKTLNEHLTPTLYASVNIQDFSGAQFCTRTLSADPSTLAFGRDLAALVRSFSLRYRCAYLGGPPRPVKETLARRLSCAAGRMTGLRYFTLVTNLNICTPNVCAALARSAAPTLRSLTMTTDQPEWVDGSDAGVLRDVCTVFQELTSISLALSDKTPWFDFLERILTSGAGRLRNLSLKFTFASVVSALPRQTPVWAHLQELELELLNAPLDTLPSTPNVRKLTLSWSIRADALARLVLPPDAFPALEALTCPYQLLPKFLPEDAQTQRPIRTVRLNNASYDEAGGDGDFSYYERPEWEELVEVLRCLPRSAGPVTDLSFYVDLLNASTFGDDLAPYTAMLERLVVVMHQDPGPVSLLYWRKRMGSNMVVLQPSAIATFGETLFAHAPKLHTFLLSDAPVKADDCRMSFTSSRDTQLGWLEAWDRHSNTLKKVAFATEFVWTKTEGGWQAARGSRDG